MGRVLRTQHTHHDDVFPAVRVQFGFTADPLPAETACQVAVDGTTIASQHLQLDAVRTEHLERPGQHQPGHLTAQTPTTQAGADQPRRGRKRCDGTDDMAGP